MPKNANDLNIKEKKCEDGNFHSCCHEIELSSYYLAWYPLSSQLGKNLNYETMRHFTHDSCILLSDCPLWLEKFIFTKKYTTYEP